jgi:hypothetical protein
MSNFEKNVLVLWKMLEAWNVPFSEETVNRTVNKVRVFVLQKKICHKFECLLSGKVCADDELCEEGPRAGEAGCELHSLKGLSHEMDLTFDDI